MDPASPARFSKQGKGALIFAMGLLAGIGIASVAIGWTGNRSKALDSPAVMNIGDGSGMMGREILAAAALLSNERGVRIEFSAEGVAGDVSVISRRCLDSPSIIIEPFLLHLTPFGVRFDDEEISREAFRARLGNIAEAARLSDSRGLVLLSCADGTSGEFLVNILHDLSEVECCDLITSDYRWIFEPRPTPPPSPQIKPLAHPVELK